MNTRSFDIDRIVRQNVRALKPYSSARDEYIADGSPKIFMDANENPYNNGLNRYPDPQQRRVKAVLAQRNKLTEEHLLLGNGSDEILDLIFRAFCEPGVDNIITAPPTYGMYKVLAGVNGVENREVFLRTDFALDVKKILSSVDNNTKLILVCSPNNPTGNRFRDEDIQQLLENFNGLLVMDEAYIDFSSEKSWLNSLRTYPNLVVTQTLSKAYGMAGIRLGICWASPEITSLLNRIKPPYNVNELTQKAALDRLLNLDSVSEQVAAIIKQRAWLLNQLEKVPFVIKIYPTDANFILVKVDDADSRYRQILDRDIVVRNRSSLPLCENTLRLTVGTAEENEKLIKVLKSI